ncbi:transposase [Bosea sp. NPDC003192]|uniref:transposase n=1 Tax=Bosea sp. NPDC003192 TaxID=3390551 RepID=UPI003D00F263
MALTLAQGVVVMHNVQAAKAAGVQAAIEATGASLLYQPPYSLDFKPTEKAFSKFKASLRAEAEGTIDHLRGNVGSLIDIPNPIERTNQFKAPGYDPE